ncbi:MAG: multidrug effflux MFS transporter [Azoarcus sp.]|jgi:DHA1 family bicyclomycin/chloramphenicol resistance-like MFS transporter|nr:multidrug effflux MFS transporter [Azoarcus sp.]
MRTNQRPAMAFGEFVGFIAACMALNAMSIDIMLPALPLLHADFKLADPNQAQSVIAFFLIGTGVSQLFYGPLADRFGRRPVLIGGLVLYTLAGILSTFADTFATLLAARVLQGIGAGAPRVMAISITRDCFAGAQMAKTMSLAIMVFMTVPVLAPSLGQVVLLAAPSWHWVFGLLVVAGAAVLVWTIRKLPETLPSERRLPLVPRAVYAAYRQTVTTRRCIGYTVALSFIVGAHMGFITSAQQIFVDVFDAGRSFTVLFALIALTNGFAAFVNSRLVHRFGMRRMSIAGLAAILVINLFHLGLDLAGHESLLTFMLLQGASVFTFGILAANLNTMAMEPMGHIAGTASSMIGFVSTVGSALIGLAIGHMFNGSVTPLVGAYVVLAVCSLAIAYCTEKPGETGAPP